MSVNRHKRHIFVLPEDDANYEIANGFRLDGALSGAQIRLLRSAGGWRRVRDEFESEHVSGMKKWTNRHMVLLVDFDEDPTRRTAVQEVVPESLADRVFVVGVWSEPEELRKEGLGSLEDVGLRLAEECRGGSRDTWNHPLLKHNAGELDRMTRILRPMLFPSKDEAKP